MLSAARDARSFIAGKLESDLRDDRLLTLGLLKCVEIIGEAASRVSEETRIKHPSLPWNDMIGMRNRLIHVYYDIDLALLWSTIVADLPALTRELEKIVERD